MLYDLLKPSISPALQGNEHILRFNYQPKLSVDKILIFPSTSLVGYR